MHEVSTSFREDDGCRPRTRVKDDTRDFDGISFELPNLGPLITSEAYRIWRYKEHSMYAYKLGIRT